MRLLLLGCTGFVGRELVPHLLARGHQLVVVSRQSRPLAGLDHPDLLRIQADPALAATWQEPALLAAVAEAEGVVNLAGEPIAEKRWSEAQRRRLLDSRLGSTRNLVEALQAHPRPGRVLVNGSAVGYYGSSEDARFSESSPAASDLLGQLCLHWEAAADQASTDCRVVKLRIGIVLGPDGGALGKMLPVFRSGLGGPIGSGRQWMSWIQRTDLCALISTALETPAYQGVYNAVAPQPARMGSFAAALGRALKRPSLLPVPAAVLQLMLGDGAAVVLEGQQVVSERLESEGFRFRYPDLDSALAAATSPAAH
ncbi:TIGR01777 family oxidoreductase [Synechococcus sp. CS-1329]|uniref:TIGR01777 family oxidoreductase n=1 Tax=Synechococcus sp. CS-1329 TaxID=2847975 RepID=UPI00223B8421|nr:TIGR01777 family oxidoreductase [Synechococcus sp. CS-1329]MCT0217636.1 TIGR01777 family oxidoreductase [Synechococcus sp. CS-1329]